MLDKLTLNLLVLSALATAATPSLANHFYIGGSLGNPDFKDACGDFANCDDNDTGYKLFAGYKFSKNFALEGFYTDLGEVSVTETESGNTIRLTAKADGIGLAAVGILPINDSFSIFAKAGFYHWDIDGKGTGNNETNEEMESDGTDFTFGLGASYAFNESIAVRAEWERYDGIDYDSKVDVNLLSAGIVFSF